MADNRQIIRTGYYLFFIILTLGIIIRLVFYFGIPSIIQNIVLFIIIFYLLICLFALFLWIRIHRKNRNYIYAMGEDILIIAPHQDDCVAIAGGYAIQTIEKKGRINIIYVTDGYRNDKVSRKREAIEAWSVIGIEKQAIHFLNYDTRTGLMEKNDIYSCIKEIRDLIISIHPGTIFIPLYEGGNYQHDLTNFMVRKSLDECGFRPTVYEAPEYNFYFSFKTTPEKILSGLARLLPFYKYDYPPEPIRDDTLYYLKMTAEQIRLKKDMLSKFKTQHPENLMERFGFEDRFQKFHAYDYSKPPLDYDRSLAKKINALKSLPFIGRVLSKAIKWTRTIHPAPNYTITKIPQ